MPDQVIQQVSEKYSAAAAMWGSGALAYDNVSFAISDALAHTAQRLNPQPGDRVLDVATGTGWSARNAARTGARVTGVDIAPRLLDAARRLSAHLEPAVDFRLAEAEKLPFPDGTFHKVISTFGVMFAVDQEAAAGELGRVCRTGGRLCLATWVPGGAVAEFFGIIGAHSDTPPPEPSPLLWGDPDHVGRLLGNDFYLVFERGKNHSYHDDEADIWRWYLEGFGPLKALHELLDEPGRAALRRDVDAYHADYITEAGLHVEREYLVTIGTRR